MSETASVIALDPPAVLTTVLFTDIVGSTRRAVELGDLEWRRLLERHDRLVRAEVASTGGCVLKNLGDGYLITFDDPWAAVDCAHGLVAAARSVGLEIRAGLHRGECQVLGDDLVGVTLHIAARVCSLAGEGTVLATPDVACPVGPGGFVDTGLAELRDIPGRFRLFEAVRATQRTLKRTVVLARAGTSAFPCRSTARATAR
jgi:class 3 adenylate cyclase